MSHVRPATRAGFTLVELMIVITVILLLASMILVIKPTNPEGLANGQRMLASMIRSAKAQALMNRAALPRPADFTGDWEPSDFRYRVLIKNDPVDPDRHLREMVIAIGLRGVGASPNKYAWFSPDASVVLPPGVYFVPPAGTPGIVMPSGTTAFGTTAATRVSKISALSDVFAISGGFDDPGSSSSPPVMRYRPINTLLLGEGSVVYGDSADFHSSESGGTNWYYVELASDGTSGHVGRVTLVLGAGVNNGSEVRFENADRFAAILLRRNGETALTVDTKDFESENLK